MRSKTTHMLGALLLLGCITPALAVAEPAPYEQEFVLTAYYSPLPDQCCYVRGSLEADRVLNGHGTQGADGTPVYPGMIAAPSSYPFGTRVALPGIGVLTVHDRGGAIQEWDHVHRLDVWMGEGEEGLARALAFGIRTVRGTVYPAGTKQPSEQFHLEEFSAPDEKLFAYLRLDGDLLSVRPESGQRGYSVRVLQDALRKAGVFSHETTGYFGTVTQQSLRRFLAGMQLDEPSDRLTDRSAAYLMAATETKKRDRALPIVDAGSTTMEVSEAQRLLRFLGFYKGRTNGVYSDALKNAILAFQKSESIVDGASAPGAGRIGPKTRDRLQAILQRNAVARRGEKYVAILTIRKRLTEHGAMVTTLLQPGAEGEAVRVLQERLAALHLFPNDQMNGVYGPLTEESVRTYQLARGIITQATDSGAGNVGPATLHMLQQEHLESLYRLVRAEGWKVL